MSDDIELDYNHFIQEAQKKAYRILMRDVLTLVADLGDAPGEHHFFVEFLTRAQGVVIPDHLLAQYPERMTIVLQHQFEELTVEDDKFGVTLWFKNKEARLEVPFTAVTQFADPSAKFGLNFDASEADGDAADSADAAGAQSADKTDASGAAKADADKPTAKTKGDGADVVSLDSFRKK